MKRKLIYIVFILIAVIIGSYTINSIIQYSNENKYVKLIIEQNQLINDMSKVITELDKNNELLEQSNKFYRDHVYMLDMIMGNTNE